MTTNQNKEGLETVAWEHKLTGIVRQKHDRPSSRDLAQGDYEPLVRASEISSLSQENERLRKERDEAHSTAKKLTKALVGLTPGGSEYFSRSALLDDYFADTEACTRVIRDRFESGHAAKIANVDAKRDLRASQAQLKIYREALESARTWHEAEDKALSKQPPSHGPAGNQWGRLQHQEQIAEIAAALSQNQEQSK